MGGGGMPADGIAANGLDLTALGAPPRPDSRRP